MTTNELKDYLHNVYLLEKQKYAIECSYTSLQNQIKQCQDIIERQKNEKAGKKFPPIFEFHVHGIVKGKVFQKGGANDGKCYRNRCCRNQRCRT